MIGALVARDLVRALRGGGLWLPLAFLLLIAALFPFAVGPDATVLGRTGGGLLWIAALLASLLPIDRLIEPDRGGWAHLACVSGAGHLPMHAMFAELLLLGEDRPQVLAFGLEEEEGYFAPALRRLSPEFRAVVQAVVLDGMSTREAGRLLHVREATVRTRLHRAKAQLRRSLTELTETPMEGWR